MKKLTDIQREKLETFLENLPETEKVCLFNAYAIVGDVYDIKDNYKSKVLEMLEMDAESTEDWDVADWEDLFLDAVEESPHYDRNDAFFSFDEKDRLISSNSVNDLCQRITGEDFETFIIDNYCDYGIDLSDGKILNKATQAKGIEP